MAISDVTKPMALDETLQDTNDLITAQNGKIDTLNTNVGNVAKDTTLQATNTALGLLGKDTSLQAIVTALATIGLNSVGNLASLTTEQKTSLVAAINELNSSKVNTSSVGVANGVAELDNTGKVPSTQLPSFVDDVLEYASVSAFPATGESGKIYVALDTNKTYRWGGSGYVVISETLALGETSSTAYRGDRGKTAYDHSQDASRVTSATSVGLYKVGATAEGHVSGLTAVEKADITALGIPGQDTTYNDATQSTHGLMSTSDKTKLDGISSNAKKVEASTTNGNIKIDGVETQVYDDSDVTSAISDLGDDVEAIEDELSTGTDTVEGNPINFTTKSAQNAKSTILSVEPIQDLHGYDKPWVGGAGKNKFDKNSTEIITNVRMGTGSGNPYPSEGYSVSAYIPVNSNTAYILTSGITSYCSWYDGSKGYISGSAWATGTSKISPSNASYLRFDYSTDNASAVQLEVGSTATSYEPYSNICPITGRSKVNLLGCGKNLFDSTQAEQGKALDQNTGAVEVNGSWAVSDYILINENTAYTYTDNGLTINNNVVFCFYDSNKTWISSLRIIDIIRTITSPAGACFVRFEIKMTALPYCQFELGSTATEYTPYTKSNDLTISLGQTVYGGTLDVENGVLVVDKVLEEINENTSCTIITQNTGNQFNYEGILVGNKNRNIIDNRFEVENNIGDWNNLPNKHMMTHPSVYENFRVRFDEFDTLEKWKTYLTSNPLQVCYELATPITINLTPHTINLLKGVNNISTDGDKITLTYRDGSVATLGDLTSAVDNLDSKIDESKILTDTVTGDKYILVVTNGVLDIQQVSY